MTQEVFAFVAWITPGHDCTYGTDHRRSVAHVVSVAVSYNVGTVQVPEPTEWTLECGSVHNITRKNMNGGKV